MLISLSQPLHRDCSSIEDMVTYAAIELIPSPIPSIMPAPIARGFLRAYIFRYGVLNIVV
jgi:hypothetical protein